MNHYYTKTGIGDIRICYIRVGGVQLAGRAFNVKLVVAFQKKDPLFSQKCM